MIESIYESFLPWPSSPSNLIIIPQTFQGLKYDCPVELHALLNYFENYWMEVVDHKLWNMYGVQRRTNNNLEGWHLRLNRAIGKAHANIYEFVSKLITEQGSTETLLAQIAAGNVIVTM